MKTQVKILVASMALAVSGTVLAAGVQIYPTNAASPAGTANPVISKTIDGFGVTIGPDANNNNKNGVAIGFGAKGDSNDAVSIGSYAGKINATNPTTSQGISIGTNAHGRNIEGVAIGKDANTTVGVAVGRGANGRGVVVGRFASTNVSAMSDRILAERLNTYGSTYDWRNHDGAGDTTSIAVGTRTTVNNHGATAVGSGSVINGYDATALGTNTQINSSRGIAIGVGSKVLGASSTFDRNADDLASDSSIAMGTVAEVQNSAFSVAIGERAKVTNANNSMALGSKSTVVATDLKDGAAVFSGETIKATDGVVSVGNDATNRRVLHVAGGIDETDAVNVRQLSAVNDKLEARINQSNSQLNSRINNVERNAEDGTALALATAGLATPKGGNNSLVVGTGFYRDSSALAVGYAYNVDNWGIKATASASSGGNFGGSVSAGFAW